MRRGSCGCIQEAVEGKRSHVRETHASLKRRSTKWAMAGGEQDGGGPPCPGLRAERTGTLAGPSSRRLPLIAPAASEAFVNLLQQHFVEPLHRAQSEMRKVTGRSLKITRGSSSTSAAPAASQQTLALPFLLC